MACVNHVVIFSILAESHGETGVTQELGASSSGWHSGPLLLGGTWPHSLISNLAT